MTEEQKLKMAEGREKKRLEKEAKKNALPEAASNSPDVMSQKEIQETAKPRDHFEDLSKKMDKMVEGLNSVGSAVLKLVEMQSQPKTTSEVSGTATVQAPP